MTRLGHATVSTDWTMLLPGLILAGIGNGMVNPPISTLAMGTVQSRHMGMASGISNVSRQTGIAFGIAALAAFLANRYNRLVTQGVTVLKSPFFPDSAKHAVIHEIALEYWRELPHHPGVADGAGLFPQHVEIMVEHQVETAGPSERMASETLGAGPDLQVVPIGIDPHALTDPTNRNGIIGSPMRDPGPIGHPSRGRGRRPKGLRREREQRRSLGVPQRSHRLTFPAR